MKVRIKERSEFPVPWRILALLSIWTAGCTFTALYLGYRPPPDWMHIQNGLVLIAWAVYYWKFRDGEPPAMAHIP